MPNTPSHNEPLSWINDAPYSKQFEDIYFNAKDGLAESRYVFLKGNHLQSRWESLKANDTFIIGETGFGTGLNFLACLHLWQQVAPKEAKLIYISAEKFPLNAQQIAQCHQQWPELNEQHQALSSAYPEPLAGLHQISISAQVDLHLYIGDVIDAFEQSLPFHPHHPNTTEQMQAFQVDAWLLDGFAPSKNPSMWTDELFHLMARHSKANSSLATFTAAGFVRRGLQSAGFEINKVKGFAHKRDMLTGQFLPQNAPTQHAQHKPTETTQSIKKPKHNNWYCYQSVDFNQANKTKTALVVGAGMAGCHTAYALAKTGWQVILIDKHASIASESSGNRQSILYTRLGWPTDALTEFNLSAFQFALRYYSNVLSPQAIQKKHIGKLNGVLQLAYTEKEKNRLQRFVEACSKDSDLCRWLDPSECSDVSGIDIHHSGLFFPNAGWLNPKNLCQHLIEHPNIQFIGNTQLEKLERLPSPAKSQQQWIAHTNQTSLSADIVVLCNAFAANTIDACPEWPLKTIRGQVSHLPQNDISESLNLALCHQGYIAPAMEHSHDVGATFTLHEDTPQVLEQDHTENIDILKAHLPELGLSFEEQKNIREQMHGKVGFRCTSTDYLPVVGQVPNRDKLIEAFAELSKRAHKIIPADDCGQQGLFVNIAHGSRGLSSTPICAQHIASLVNNQLSPLSQSMQRTLHPARFLIRQIKRREVGI